VVRVAKAFAFLVCFFTIILVLFVAEIAGAVYIFVKKDTIRDQIAVWYKEQLVNKYDEVEEVRKQLDQIQSTSNCCGATGCTDYNNRTKGPPESCKCGEGVKPGCSNQAFDTISKHIVIVAAIAIGVLGVELLAMIFSCILCTAIRNAGYTYE